MYLQQLIGWLFNLHIHYIIMLNSVMVLRGIITNKTAMAAGCCITWYLSVTAKHRTKMMSACDHVYIQNDFYGITIR